MTKTKPKKDENSLSDLNTFLTRQMEDKTIARKTFRNKMFKMDAKTPLTRESIDLCNKIQRVHSLVIRGMGGMIKPDDLVPSINEIREVRKELNSLTKED